MTPPPWPHLPSLSSHGLAANLSLLFTEHSMLRRPAAARAAGFTRVEVWWPFGTNPTPNTETVEEFVSAVKSAGVELVAMNLFGGDMEHGERGVLSHPEHTAVFRRSVDIAMRIGACLGTRLFNAPYGHRRPDLAVTTQDETATENIAFAMEAARRIGGTVLLEPLSGMPQYPLRMAADAVTVIDHVSARSGLDNLRILLDIYHFLANGEDLQALLPTYADLIAHVQIADVPGRGEPGSGSADLRSAVADLVDHGYRGLFALEYIPRESTKKSLEKLRVEGWLPTP